MSVVFVLAEACQSYAKLGLASPTNVCLGIRFIQIFFI